MGKELRRRGISSGCRRLAYAIVSWASRELLAKLRVTERYSIVERDREREKVAVGLCEGGSESADKSIVTIRTYTTGKGERIHLIGFVTYAKQSDWRGSFLFYLWSRTY